MLRGALAAAALAACAFQAKGATTPVNAHGNGDGAERCLAGTTCTAGAYSDALSIVRAFEVDRGLAAGTLQRVDDALDRQWTKVAENAAVMPFASYAADESTLGVSAIAEGDFAPLTPSLASARVWVDDPAEFAGTHKAGDFRQNPFAWAALGGEVGSIFAFVLRNLSANLDLSSDAALAGFDNSGYAQDWVVTYRVPGMDLFLLAWEDRTAIRNGKPNDYDYNDYVFVVRGAAPTPLVEDVPLPTPLPAALASFALGLGLLAGAVRRRASRAWRRVRG
jgi:hypothetical protein